MGNSIGNFMRLLKIPVFFLLSISVFGQMLPNDTSIFSVRKVQFTTEKFNDYLLGNTDKVPKMLFSSVLNEFEFDTGIDNLWIKFKMPVDFIPLSQSTAAMNLDNLGSEELLVKGLVKVWNGIDTLVQKTFLIFQLGETSLLIFELNYGCIPLTNYNENYNVWQTDENCDIFIELEDNKIIVSRQENYNSTLICCNKSTIASGTYILMDGKIRKK